MNRIIVSRIIKHHIPVEVSCAYLEGQDSVGGDGGTGRLMIVEHKSLSVEGSVPKKPDRSGVQHRA